MNRAFVRRRMRTELGADWESFFTSFDQDPAAAASLGQVHRAVTLGGQHVACKLQYPYMESAVEADLKQLKIIFSIFEKYDRTISTQHIHAELKDRLKEELDYTQEAAHCRLYEFMLRHENSVHVPVINENLSTHRLLTTNWLDGKPILEYKNADLEIRNRLAMNMFRAWYVPLYHYGVIHGDPHLGNYSVCDNQDINLMDFGCIRIFPARFIGGVIDLYHALMDDDKARAVQAYETWGFTGLTHDQIDTLNIWARFLYAPVMDDKVRTIGETSNGVYGRETAEKVHKKLKELGGGINVPREFVFMDRAALGLGSVFIHLQAEVNWYRLFNEMIDGFNVDRLHETQQSALQQFGLTSPLS
jgi:predicted unusual protein kinase regulating ubiquinone biosynthesis (AarF/ABC1/UbiB family)